MKNGACHDFCQQTSVTAFLSNNHNARDIYNRDELAVVCVAERLGLGNGERYLLFHSTVSGD